MAGEWAGNASTSRSLAEPHSQPSLKNSQKEEPGQSRSRLARRQPGPFQQDARLPDQAVQSFGHTLGLIYTFSNGIKWRNLLFLFFGAEKGEKKAGT